MSESVRRNQNEKLFQFLNENNFEYTHDSNPSPEKVSRIQKALSRKQSLMRIAGDAYRQVFGISV